MPITRFSRQEGDPKCRTQQTSKRLQEYGIGFLKTIEGVGRVQSGQW
jgi:hypothetical protein